MASASAAIPITMTVPASVVMPLVVAMAFAVMVAVAFTLPVMVAKTGIGDGRIIRTSCQHQRHDGRRDRRKLSDPAQKLAPVVTHRCIDLVSFVSHEISFMAVEFNFNTDNSNASDASKPVTNL